MTLKKFNIRIYGLLIEDEKILIVDEIVRGSPVTKFPGGGLELGEGPIDCIVREFLEETGMQVQVTEHFYTTDFFQQSAFNADDQIISIYYKLQRTGELKPNHLLPVNETETLLGLRWLPLRELTVETVHLPIDKVVVRKLMERI
ncbi:MAG: NUDIX domain-containing protein [Chitinophagales bacterium]|nr:NUDIX domain-containing protein [Chitinophagales bacterium]